MLSSVLTSTVHAVAKMLWGVRTDLSNSAVCLGEVADGAGRIFTHLVGPEPTLRVTMEEKSMFL